MAKKDGKKYQIQADKGELKILAKIDMERFCEREVQQWLELVESDDFVKNLDKQDEASLISRGMHLKVEIKRIKDAIDSGDMDQAARMIRYLARNYGCMYDKKEGRTDPVGSEKNPLTVQGSLDIDAIKAAIKRDKQRTSKKAGKADS